MSIKLTDTQLVLLGAAVDDAAEPDDAGEESDALANRGQAAILSKLDAKDARPAEAMEPGHAGPSAPRGGSKLTRIIAPASPDEGDPARVAAPRDGSKLAQVIELLRRADGATIVDLTQATGWLPYTTRAALTGLRKRGYAVICERIGAGDSVYRVSDAPAYRGDRTVPERDAVDGRGPKQKATQAA